MSQCHKDNSDSEEDSFCFKNIAANVLESAAEDYKNENSFSAKNLLRLRATFGVTFEKALELYEDKKVTIVTSDTSAGPYKTFFRYFYEVKGQQHQAYTIFPNINFCDCTSFGTQVLNTEPLEKGQRRNFTCKHVLAAWIASVCPDKVNQQVVAASKYSEIIQDRLSYK